MSYAVCYGNNQVNSSIGVYETDGTSQLSINGNRVEGEYFIASANVSSGNIIAKKAGKYRILITAFSTPSYSDVTVNANQTIWSYSSRFNGAIVVFPL